MKNSELIYDSTKNVITTSSDICFFNYPGYEVEDIDSTMQGLTSESSNVFIIEEDISIPININFVSNLSYLTEDVDFSYQILPLDKQNQVFTTNGMYTSDFYDYGVATSGDTYSSVVDTADLLGEGEYLMKLSYQYPACTQIASKMGKRYTSTTYSNTLPYGHLDKNQDKYFVMIYKAEEPLLDVGISGSETAGQGETTPTERLKINALVVQPGVSDYVLNITTQGDILITLNGLLLTRGEDYTLNNGNISFAEPLKATDLVNYVFIGKDNTSGLKSETISIDNVITSGTTGNQGTNNVYYNTDSGKYEIYTQYRIKNPDSAIVFLKGVMLTNQVDYYVSTSDSRRIILQGDVYVGDWLNVIYDSGENINRGITEGFMNVSWYVNKPITNTNGEFTIELSEGVDFNTIVQSETVPYVIGQTSYTKKVDLNYEYGTILYYRIKNTKKYITLSGESLNTDNLSDSIRIEIKTNISNNY